MPFECASQTVRQAMNALSLSARPSPIAATVDFDADGVQHGHLRLPHSRDDSAWGSVMIPIAVVKRGDGPTALLTGGNHGDEYEGPIALFDLARALRAEDVTGRIIIAPAMNYPAFCAGARTSPIDKGNLNRAFPGRPDGRSEQPLTPPRRISSAEVCNIRRKRARWSDAACDLWARRPAAAAVRLSPSRRRRRRAPRSPCRRSRSSGAATGSPPGQDGCRLPSRRSRMDA